MSTLNEWTERYSDGVGRVALTAEEILSAAASRPSPLRPLADLLEPLRPVLRDGRESDIPGASMVIRALTDLNEETVTELISVFVDDAADRPRFWRVAEVSGMGVVGSLAAVMDDDGDVWVMSQWSVEGYPFVSAALYRELLRWTKRQPEARRIVTSAPDEDAPAGRFLDVAGFHQAGQVQAPLLGAPQERWMVKEV